MKTFELIYVLPKGESTPHKRLVEVEVESTDTCADLLRKTLDVATARSFPGYDDYDIVGIELLP